MHLLWFIMLRVGWDNLNEKNSTFADNYLDNYRIQKPKKNRYSLDNHVELNYQRKRVRGVTL